MEAFPIRQFKAEGVFGDREFILDFTDNSNPAFIIVGPNGTGKSTVLSLYWLFISRKWSKLASQEFSRLSLSLQDGSVVSLNQSDLFLAKGMREVPPSMARYMNALSETDFFSLLRKSGTIDSRRIGRLASEAGIPEARVRDLAYILRNEPSLFNSVLSEVEKKLDEIGIDSVLYLPTFRRIEKNISFSEPQAEPRSNKKEANSFIELVKSGMTDVYELVKNHISDINGQSRIRSTRAVQEFIRGMVQGEVDHFSMSALKDQDN